LLALYPSNKLEHLSFLLTTLLKQQPTPLFCPETILVESPGMQHWISMQLAREQGVAMNIDFPLPVRFMWNTARAVLGSDTVPKQSPYRREVLVWRIDKLLQDSSLMAAPAFEDVLRYWQRAGSEQEQGVQRLQLATALADVYEQYLLYRPDWLFAWENNERIVFNDMEIWQSEIWRQLTQSEPLHPARLHQLTLDALSHGTAPSQLPQRVVVFAINTMAPQLIAFFDALAQHTDIHIFHLNPSVNYWGDAKSDSELAQQLRMEGLEKWMSNEQSNPLLGNLGKQGRELFNLLTELDTFEISAFDAPSMEENTLTSSSEPASGLLEYIHHDILHAAPAQPKREEALKKEDDSVTIMCAHSALREVQVLHDHLLYWLSQDKTRTPSDILVMCPAIENYAPFVDAVFHRVGTKPLRESEAVRLPCSIADRSPMDAEPLIAAFMALLQLPDSRFGVSDIMDYVQLDAVQKRFNITQGDIDQILVWLKQAHIHWGLDSQHKSFVSEGVTEQDAYSWWWGLRRLLMGMLAPDKEWVVDNLLTIPDVEGQSALVLGKLIEIVDLLGTFADQLNTPRTPAIWADVLLELRDACFKPTKEQERSWDLIAKVAADLAARCEEAEYDYTLSLRQVRELLLNRFSSPDAGNHFMTGQVTVCSMLPMRSIPFKKVCILGLNDSEFPRKSTPLGLDLMAGPARRLGDRSRRLEDRYLFLEAIISTRESLYLSYQGNDVKNNSERQPSLVLAEFLDMLALGYQVPLSRYVTHAPLHPFSEANFMGRMASFEKGWLRLAKALHSQKRSPDDGGATGEKHASVEPTTNSAPTIALSDGQEAKDLRLSSAQIARGFKDPLAFFAQQRLGVNLSHSAELLDNSEPFETNALIRYQVLDAIFTSPMDARGNDENTLYSEQVAEFARLRGDIPDNPVAQDELNMWKEGAHALTQAMGPVDSDVKRASFTGKHITFTASAYEGADSLIALSAGKVNDIKALEYFISQLVFCSEEERQRYSHYPLDIYFCDWEKGETKLMKRRCMPMDKDIAAQILLFIEALFIRLYTTPTPLYRSLFADFIPGKRKSDSASVVAMIKPDVYHQLLDGLSDVSGMSVESEGEQDVLRKATALFETELADRLLKNWLQTHGQYTPDMANNPYLKWLYPEGVSWRDLPYKEGFILFAMVHNAAMEEAL